MLDKQAAGQVVDRYFAQADSLAQFQYFGVTDWTKLTIDTKLQDYLLLLCEFAKRYALKPPLELGQICSSKVIGEYMSAKLALRKQEVLWGVYLDTKNQILAQEEIFVGTLNEATVHPREILKLALKYSAARFIVVHNHPSGQVTPSPNDIALTRRLQACGELLGIALLDHIIVGEHTYLSMREEKY